MAIGFGSTRGVSGSDRIVTASEAIGTEISFHCWLNRNGEGGGGLGRIFDRGSLLLFNNHPNLVSTYAIGLSSAADTRYSWDRPTTGVWAPTGFSVDTTSSANAPTIYQSQSKLTIGSGVTRAGSLATWPTASAAWCIGNRASDGVRGWDGDQAEVAWWNVILTDDEFYALQKGISPDQIRPEALQRYFPFVRSGAINKFGTPGTVTGTAAQPHPRIIYQHRRFSKAVVVDSGSVTGSVAVTNADDISAANATPIIVGESATTNADDVSAASASHTVIASSATTNADDVSSAAASPVVSASAAITNADDISDASAAVGSEVVGSVAYTNIDDVSSATLKATVTASVAVTNSDDISSAFSGAVVDGSVAVTNADDVSVGSASPVVSLSSATTNADDISSAEAVAETGEIIASVNVTNANDISNAAAAPVITASIAYSNLHDLSAAIAEINFGTIVEALLTTGIIQDTRIKKPGIPSDAPEWQRTMFEIFTGRRGNKINVAPHQNLTFSATPTQAECEALYNYISEVRQSIDQLTKRFDS